MAFDPAQDPWGAALLATAGLSGLGLLLALVARGLGRSATFGGWLMGLALVGFLGSAVAGAVVRVESTLAAEADPGTESVSATDESDADAPVAEDDVASDDEGDDDDDDDDDADAADEEARAEDPLAEPTSAVGSRVARPEALPSDPAELRSVIRIILRDGKQVAESKNACTDPQQLANMWARISAIPDEAWSSRGNVIVRKLDGCRRKVVWTTLYVVRHERVNGRAAFVSTFEQRLQDSGKAAAVSVHERNNTRLRVGSQSMTHEEFAAMLEGGLRKELESLGFDRITFSDGSKAETQPLEPVSDQAIANARLEPYGLVERFSR
jgi:hypothetical protein